MSDCAHSQPPVRTSLLVRAAGFSPDISGSWAPSCVSPSVYWRANFEAVGAFSGFSLRALFRHLRNVMQQGASISSNADAFGRRPANDWTGFLEKAECDALLRPVGRNIALHQVSQSELSRLGAMEDGLSNAGGEIRSLIMLLI